MALYPFSDQLVTAHPRFAAFGTGSASDPFRLAVVDQLIVAPQRVTEVLNALNPPHGHFRAEVIATVFQGLGVIHDDQDPRVIKIESLPPTPPGGQPAIFAVADRLRASPKIYGSSRRNVSLNHVLVPSAWIGAGCPSGPPRGLTTPPSWSPPPAQENVHITVLDAGYNDWWSPHETIDPWGAKLGPWPGVNPLLDVCDIAAVHRADYLVGSGSLESLARSYGHNWAPGTPDQPSMTWPGVLDALAGHANFVAGVVAKHVDMPTIHIWSHNAAFVTGAVAGPGVPTVDEFPCEASVCRSIVQSQVVRPTRLIHAGFAFPVAPLTGGAQEAATASDDFVSLARNVVFDYLQKRLDPLVIAPAGNEAVFDAYYPAALDATFHASGKFKNVKGVASMAPGGAHPSKFTNRGPWVACAAYGEGVQSTFIPVGPIVCEDDMKGLLSLPPPGTPPPAGLQRQDFRNSFASWQGTSFSAPKVTSAVGAGMAHGMTAAAAYAAVVANASSHDPNLGYTLTHI